MAAWYLREVLADEAASSSVGQNLQLCSGAARERICSCQGEALNPEAHGSHVQQRGSLQVEGRSKSLLSPGALKSPVPLVADPNRKKVGKAEMGFVGSQAQHQEAENGERKFGAERH